MIAEKGYTVPRNPAMGEHLQLLVYSKECQCKSGSSLVFGKSSRISHSISLSLTGLMIFQIFEKRFKSVTIIEMGINKQKAV
jgi:hypothetical protein